MPALTVTGMGGLAMIAGLLILGQIVGSYDLSVILTQKDAIQASPYYLPALILILIGAFAKSAQFPFHFWLPHAMAAPTPVSAYLHSATMVKAGLFLMARLWPVLAGTEAWFYIVATTGLITMVLGAVIALFKDANAKYIEDQTAATAQGHSNEQFKNQRGIPFVCGTNELFKLPISLIKEDLQKI